MLAYETMLALPPWRSHPARTNGAALKMSGGLPRVAQAGAGVVHTFALAVHAPIALRAALFGRAALVGDFGDAFLLGGFAGAGFAALGLFGVCVAGGGQQAQRQADGEQGADALMGAGGGCVKGWHTGLVEGLMEWCVAASPLWRRWCGGRHAGACGAILPRRASSSTTKNPVDAGGLFPLYGGWVGRKAGSRYNRWVLHGARRTPVALPASGASKTCACGPSKGWLLAAFKEKPK